MKENQYLNKKSLIIISFITFALTLMFYPSLSYNDSDTFWHIELGRYMIENKTIIQEGIHAFNETSYVPHEIGFQLIAGFLFIHFGWAGLYLFTAVCLFFLIYGLYELTRISRKENGFKEDNVINFLFILALSVFIYFIFFTNRPQIISAPIMVWFVIYLRRFQYNKSYKNIIILSLLSLLLANVHTGVWIIIIVFYIMAILESIFEKSFTKQHIILFSTLVLTGLLNYGGLETLLYFQTGTTDIIAEWTPINVGDKPYLFIFIALLFVSLLFKENKQIFRFFFALGILYLAIRSHKTYLYLLLYLPYLIAMIPNKLTILNKMKDINKNHMKYLWIMVISILILNIVTAFIQEYEEPVSMYPVEEMDYILEDYNKEDRPKVLANYGASGYVMFRGGNILADGRYDPFINDKTIGVHDWNAVQRSYYGFNNGFLEDIIEYDQPDYLILSKDKDKLDKLYREELEIKIGEPSYVGKYGYVYKLNQ